MWATLAAFSVLGAMASLTSCTTSDNTPVALLCEYQTQPFGLDVQTPRFFWQIESSKRGTFQRAYQLIVASSEALALEGKGDVWDSGWVENDSNVQIEYAGKALEPYTRYFWRVRIKDEKKYRTQWSQPTWFETGKMEAPWQAQWIAHDGKDATRSSILKKTFTLDKAVQKARLYATGLGNYVTHINGQRVGDQILTPGWTDYFKRLSYQTYDVTAMLKQGENEWDALLGRMWWSGGLGWNTGAYYSQGPNRFLAELVLTFADGTQQVVATDGTWKGVESPITYDHIYHGEHYDARLEGQPATTPVKVLADFTIPIGAQVEEPIRITGELKAVAINKVGKDTYVFDFGQNQSGCALLTVQGKAGQVITLRYAELLHPDGTVAQENLRSARVTDQYTLKGGDPESYFPTFTYHGYRYVQVSGLTEEPTQETLVAKVFHTDAAQSGLFACSNELLNKIWSNSYWGLRSNIMGVPTDCPQRDERLGWMGDGQIYARTGFYNMRLPLLYSKWTRDMRDGQSPEGYLCDVNPAIVVGGPSKPAWADAMVTVPVTTYLFYGDTRILEENYQAMKSWVDYMYTKSQDNIYIWRDPVNPTGNWGGYGDWVPVEPSPADPIAGDYFYLSTWAFSQVAGILGKTDDAKTYADRLPAIVKAYMEAYYNPQEKQFLGATQTANLLPLVFGVIPDKETQAIAFQNIVDNIKAHNNHLTTGFIGSNYLLPALSNGGQHELAYTLATQRDYPSWGYMVDKGATTIWELWNSDTERPEGMNSRNHFTYGGVASWYYGYLAGIRPTYEGPGFKKSIIAPRPAGDLTWAKASLETLFGTLASSWQLEDGHFYLEVIIPANTVSTVSFPVKEGYQPLPSTSHVQYIKTEDGIAYYNVQSGKYSFDA